MPHGGPEGGFSAHLERVVWKPITWDPEAPEQLSGGLPVPRPESWLVPMRGTIEDFRAGRTGAWYFRAWPLGPKIELFRVGPGVDRAMALVAEFAADQIPAIVDALLYVHRRTHEHDYTGPDAGRPPARGRGSADDAGISTDDVFDTGDIYDAGATDEADASGEADATD